MILWLKILNKNIDDNTGTPREFPFDENCLYTNNYNETLDSFKGRISHTSEIDIEPYDECEVNFKELDGTIRKTLYFCVDTYTLKQDTIGIDNEKFSYDIELFSQTKLLEGIICPNLSITPYKLETNKPRKSIYWYLDKYLELYGRKARYYDESDHNYNWFNKWYFSQDVISKFSSVDAPEMQWNAPTLREVFNDLFMIKDCIPVLKNNEIGLIDLTQKKNPITDYNFLTRSQSADNYVSEIKMNLQNVMQTQLKDIKNTCITNEYLSFNSADYLITSDNLELHTTFPILNIKHLWMYMFENETMATPTKARLRKVDLCNWTNSINNPISFVKEYQEYRTLSIKYDIALDITNKKSASTFQNYCIFFERGSNVITGFNTISKRFVKVMKTTLELLKEMMVSEVEIQHALAPYKNSYFSTFFKIEYETMTDQVFTASKNGAKNKRTIVDNQTNSWVDAYSQGFLEYMKANRLGNQITMYNQRTSNVWNTTNFGLIDIGDFKDDNVVYQVQYQIFQDHIECNAYATKNYILRNYWVGVNSKIRTWVNAQDEALIRHELEKYYCNVDFTTHREYDLQYGKLGRLCAKSLDNQTSRDKSLNYAIVQTTNATFTYPFVDIANTDVLFDVNIDNKWGSQTQYAYLNFVSDNTNFDYMYYQDGELWYHKSGTNVIIKVFGTPTESSNKIWMDENGLPSQKYRQVHIINSSGDGSRTNETMIPMVINFIKALGTITTNGENINYYFANELVSRVMGNSLVFTIGFNSNYEVNKCFTYVCENDIEPMRLQTPVVYEPYLADNSITEYTSNKYGIQTIPLKYVDDFGEFDRINIKLYKEVEDDGTNNYTNQYKKLMAEIIRKPLIKTDETFLAPVGDFNYDFHKYYYKDNKEIFKLSIQFEYYSGNENIFLGDKLAYNNSFVRDSVLSSQPRYLRYFLGNNTEIHTNTIPSGVDEIYNDYQLGDIQMETRLTDVNDSITRVGVLDNGRNFDGYNTLYITNQEGEVLIALRYTPSQVQTGELFIYFNVVRDRDLSVYDENNNIIEEI